jgi:adenosine deaminase
MSMNDGPLIELHRHLDGAVRLETIFDLGQQHGLPLPADTLEGLRPYVQVTEPVVGVMAFVAKFEWMQQVMVDSDAVRRIAYENVADAAAEGIDYIELRFSPVFMAEAHDLEPAGVVRAVCEGVAQGEADFPVKVGLIGIMSRTYGVERCWDELDSILRGRGPAVVGIDLAGDEIAYPGRLFVDHIRRAREAGLRVTVHAGEISARSPHAALGLENVWVAAREMEAERLGHAVRAVDDPALLDLIGERGIGIESCLTSNLQTSVVPSYAVHPLKTFLERGLLATLNTDDPGISAITLEHEYQMAANGLELPPAGLRQLRDNARKVAFHPLPL